MKIIRTTIIEIDDLEELLKQKKDGDQIILYEGAFTKWAVHPEGVIIQKEGKLLLNGERLIYETHSSDWAVHPEGIVVRDGQQFLLNGKEIWYSPELVKRWDIHPNGIALSYYDDRTGNIKIMLNNKELLHGKDFTKWKIHPQGKGIILQCNGKISLDNTSSDPDEILYKGYCNNWTIHPEGIVIQKGKKILLNGKKLLATTNSKNWAVHPEGIVVKEKNKLLLLLV